MCVAIFIVGIKYHRLFDAPETGHVLHTVRHERTVNIKCAYAQKSQFFGQRDNEMILDRIHGYNQRFKLMPKTMFLLEST